MCCCCKMDGVRMGQPHGIIPTASNSLWPTERKETWLRTVFSLIYNFTCTIICQKKLLGNKSFKSYLLHFRFTTMDVFIPALQFLCYSGNFLSGMIARNIYRMQQRTLFNKMFLIYFSIDCLIGMIHPNFLFQLFRERYNTNIIQKYTLF